MNPRPKAWLEVLDWELARLPAAETTVLTHSLGGLLWLHHAVGPQEERVGRALLVAPSQPDEDHPESAGFRPTPLDQDGVEAAAHQTLFVCSTDDPWCPPETSRRIAEATAAPIYWLENAGHINTAAGFGPWPWVEEWALRLGGGSNRSPHPDLRDR
jgi:predicted alpha/beta hydrolase family esterase